MTYLYVDTCSSLTVGVLSEQLKWLSYSSSKEAKPSAKLHPLINKQLENANLEVKQLKAFIHCAGPGSYTGMRVSKGIQDIFHLFNIDSYSFYHFEIPSFLDVPKGRWFSNAFKGEFFVHSWNKGEVKKQLLRDFQKEESDYTYTQTVNLIEKFPQKIFSQILKDNTSKKTYYFRDLKDEFTRA